MKPLREDLELQSLAESLGFITEKHVMDKERDGTPHFSLTFKRGDKVIWNCITAWACADIVKNPVHYANHRYYSSLAEALEKEK